MNKQQAYDEATLISYAENPMGDRMDVIFKAMDIYAVEKAKEAANSNERVRHWLIGYLVNKRQITSHNETMAMAEALYQTLVETKALSGNFEI